MDNGARHLVSLDFTNGIGWPRIDDFAFGFGAGMA
jgi:hypothetical protein